ncbi:MAG: PIN domain-containing protein [Armatimonadetes bacterium]|nr:PIN domain-containing protein [Armatimonadota bacterium]
MVQVLDAGAMIAYLSGEAGGAVVNEILNDPSNFCLAHAVSLCEVFYEFFRSQGEAAAQAAITALYGAGVQSREDMDPEFWQTVGRLKVSPGRISLADCFLLALALRTGGEVVTADHHEFDRLVPLGLCPIRFIR